MEKIKNIALLIDAENIDSKYIDKILAELGQRGRVIVKRAYADWTKSQAKPLKKQGPDFYNLWEVLSAWYQLLPTKGILPMQQSQNTVGKNSSDIYLVIDAMDLMYQGVVDTFCIVSSDGDFTRLCTRLTEAGKEVIVMGENHTPSSVKAAAEFVNLGYAVEKFGNASAKREAPKKAAKSEENKPKDSQPKTAKSVPAPKTQPQDKPLEPKPKKKDVVFPILVKKASERDDLPPQEETAKTAPSAPKTAEITAEKQVSTGKDYDDTIISDIKKLIQKHKNQNNEINYQKLLELLRKAHPECDKIKKGEKNILDIFKNVPGVAYRTESGNYMFSIEGEAKAVEQQPKVEDTAKIVETVVEKPSEKPQEKPVEKAAEKSAKKAKKKPQKPNETKAETAAEPVLEQEKEANEEVVEKPQPKSAEKAAKKPAKKAAKSKKPAKKQADKKAEEADVKAPATETPVAEAKAESEEKPIEKPSEKPSKKPRKTAKKSKKVEDVAPTEENK